MKESTIFSLEDSWLSGFIDAEGCFESHIKKVSSINGGKRLSLKFSISQKDPEILIKIRDAIQLKRAKNNFNLDSPSFKIRYDSSWEGHTYGIEGIKDLTIISNYLRENQLKTKKLMDFLHFKKLLG
jgi:hypothetical protein